jgi:hypothetical protein
MRGRRAVGDDQDPNGSGRPITALLLPEAL